jgi:GT2 family glycosyltransferase
MIDQIGGFDEDFFAYADDAELGLRARIAGWGCIYMPDAVVRHHRGSTLGVLSSRRMELIERNRILLAVKLFPASLLALNGFYFSLRIGAGLIAAMRGRGEVARFPGFSGKLRIAAALLRANLDALRMLPSTLRKRRAFHPLRRLNARQTKLLLKHYRISLKTLMEQAI